ncbi:hypothetical protein X777_05510 [Ooceraea biroi]|uniref:Uncharacterized protein n=1 Tax=Ooceraea biroi TaxID=2015173 RepID=A0A026WFT5_OOCBI|nr:hypothetical protein X777_05510 [Ooceraea biroi]
MRGAETRIRYSANGNVTFNSRSRNIRSSSVKVIVSTSRKLSHRECRMFASATKD